MKTYCETRRRKPFNWFKFLDRAERGETTSGEIESAKKRAENWTTCMCGNQCAIIPRHAETTLGWRIHFKGEPEDNTLAGLGISFCEAVYDCEWKRARKIGHQIEKRSAQLIAKILKEKASAGRKARNPLAA